MKTVKFRIWNGMEMVYDITAGKFGTFYVNPEKGDGLNPEDTASLTMNTTKYHEGTPLMQFTGYKDVEDAEIYEGDIVKSLNGQIELAVVDFFDAAFFLKVKDPTRPGDIHSEIFHWPANRIALKVVGNIYENPDMYENS